MITLDTHERMLFALLSAALSSKTPDEALFLSATADDWRRCCRLATRNGVLIIAWDAAKLLPAVLQPPMAVKVSWALAVEKYEKKYMSYCNAVCELSDLYEANGIRMVQMKGVGLSTCYPVPSHREGGDIDIYTYSADVAARSDDEANALANKLMQERGIEVDYGHSSKHTIFYYNGIPVENHRTFVDAGDYEIGPMVEEMLKRLLSPQRVELLPGRYIYAPSPQFNTLFLAFHAAQHYGAGLALHHLCDWACHINKHGLHLPAELNDVHFVNGVKAFTHLCNNYLGSSIPVEGGEKLADGIMEDIIHPFSEMKRPSTFCGIVKYKLKEYSYIYPVRNYILHTPLWRNAEFWGNVFRPIGNKILSIWQS